MKTNIGTGDLITVPAPSAVKSGDVVVVGLLHGVAQRDAAPGEDVDLVTNGNFTVKKAANAAWTIGAAIYVNPTSGVCTTASTAGNLFIGVALSAAATADASGNIRLNGASPAAVTS